MKKLIEALSSSKLNTCLKLEATEVKRFKLRTQLLPDFDLVGYDGPTIKDYPIWHEFDLSEQASFLHKLNLDDYGYEVDHPDRFEPDYEMPKKTSDSTGGLNLHLHSIDRFGCRAMVRGNLSGSHYEMEFAVGFKFTMACFSSGHPSIGYAAEAIAEGLAFEGEGKLKQAFFAYFAALDSFLDSEREKLNRGRSPDEQISAEIRMIEKLRPIMIAHLPGNIAGLNKIKLWADVKNGFDKSEKIRNAIAHNTKTHAITQDDVDLCFTVLAVIIAMIKDNLYEENEITEHYAI